jgi:peptidoglycan hydrolase CwlO-like protein
MLHTLWHTIANVNGITIQKTITMKKLILVAIPVVGMTLYGCENYKQQADQLTRERDSLIALNNAGTQTIDEFVSTLTDVENNLSKITEKQNSIALAAERNPEAARNSRERLNAQIEEINRMMSENKAKVEELTKKLKGSHASAAKFEKMVKSLQEQLQQKEQELAVLNEKLGSLNMELATLKTNFDSLSVMNQNQATVIADQTTKIHTAYYTVGNYKKLRDKKVLAKQGGVLGLGKKATVVPAIKEENFTKIDYTQVSTIPVNSKKVELVTTHPEGSYKIEKNKDLISDILITDPEKFWSASKYLVVLTK